LNVLYDFSVAVSSTSLLPTLGSSFVQAFLQLFPNFFTASLCPFLGLFYCFYRSCIPSSTLTPRLLEHFFLSLSPSMFSSEFPLLLNFSRPRLLIND
jgi:hypothetical protein